MRTVDVLEKDGQGLNLTFEVRDGIRNHQTKGNPATLEGKIVRLSDKIAYLHHDCDDAIRAGILKEEDIPKEIQEAVGRTTGERLDHFIHDIVTNSSGKNEICMSPAVGEGLKKLRAFLYVNVYTNPYAKSEEGEGGASGGDAVRILSAPPGKNVSGVPHAHGAGRTQGTGGLRLHRGDDGPVCHRRIRGNLYSQMLACEIERCETGVLSG